MTALHPPPRTYILRRWLAALALCCLAGGAHAAVRCVGTAAALTSAVAEAENAPEGTTWDIRVRTGTYQLDAGLTFDPDGDKDNKEFLLRGGWNAQCTARELDPSLTVLHAVASTANSVGSQFFFYGDNARYDIESIRFENFYDFQLADGYCPPYNSCPDTDSVVLRYNEFRNAEAVHVDVRDARRLEFRDNLVADINPIHYTGAAVDDAPVFIEVENDEDAPQISFNTFARVHCVGALGGVVLLSHNDATALHHNVFDTECATDVYISDQFGGVALAPYYNLYLHFGGAVAGNLASQGNVLASDAKFVDAANGNYRLQITSPAVNAGLTFADAILGGYVTPAQDMDGHPRPTGSRYDLGAYESAVNDAAPQTITVTNANDAGAGSLRAAITQANNQPGVAQRIVFDIPGACPRVIALRSELPDVTDTLLVDGYTQPGASPNTLDRGSDATLCIVLTPAAGGIAHAFEVPSGQPATTRLGVQGIAFATGFGQFTSVAIDLRAGSQHRIAGNAFGGTGPGALGALGSLRRGVAMHGTATQALVGGPQPGDRNTFGGMTENAIIVSDAGTSGHVIQNNYVGLKPDGLSVEPNSADGISITGGTDIRVLDNVIDASTDGIYIAGAATQGVRVQRNRIGVNAIGIGIAAHANDNGIVLDGGTSQHTIGYATNDAIPIGRFSNDIRNNDHAGVLLTVNAGGAIVIRGNRIEANGRSGTGLGIDLGAYGQLGNDAGDADSGPNLGQNWPQILTSTPSGTQRHVTALLETKPNQSVRVDFYRAASCPAGATGANATTYVGSAVVDSGATGVVNVQATLSGAGAPGWLTATATRLPVGETSELAPCFQEVDDGIFADDFE